ncbi:ATP-binding protein [Robbsia andropogonis]|uniref:ATP-binding protein n=1 Tax=Robbsia andropogonis TaxID=28092 RepID=UPI0022A9B452
MAGIGDATIADAILDRVMQRHHRFTLTGDSLRLPREKNHPKRRKPSTHRDRCA